MLKPVTELAVKRRVTRFLNKQGKSLRKCPENSPWRQSLGDHYVIDTQTNSIEMMDFNIEEFARHQGLLKAGEVIESPREYRRLFCVSHAATDDSGEIPVTCNRQ